MKEKIMHDVYNISKRIKDIDRDYYIVYDTSKQNFEIHNYSQIGSSYCLTLPYCELDERTLMYVLKTQSTNIDEILENIENENRLRESTIKTSAFSTILNSIEDMEKENESY